MPELHWLLSEILLPEVITVPSKFAVKNLNELEKMGSPYGEAQFVKRLLFPGVGHDEAKILAQAAMGVVDPYLLCREKVWDMNLTPREKLKLYAKLGDLEKPLGLPVLEVNVDEALTPYEQTHEESYLMKYIRDQRRVLNFFKGLRQKYYSHRFEVLELQDKFTSLRFPYKKIVPCGQVVTPETHPIRNEYDEVKWWEANKPNWAK